MPEGRLANPFPGLRPFCTEEDQLFFGRERETAELIALLGAHRFLTVVGTSGSGKSSLVRAGVIPALYRGTMGHAGSSWEVVIVRPGGSPLHSLAHGLCAEGPYDTEDPEAEARVAATLAHSGRGLVEACRQSDIDRDTNLLVVVDPFDEIFRFQQQSDASQDEADRFVDSLLEASTQTDCPIYVVLTLRSEHVGDCSRFRGLTAAVNAGEYLVPRLDRDDLRRAVEGPMKVAGGRFSRRLVQRVLNDARDDSDQLPVFQHALMRTWERWAEESGKEEPGTEEPVDLSHYDAIGRMAEAASRHADEVWEALPGDESRAIAARAFRALTGRSADNRGICRPTTIARLEEIAGATRDGLLAVIEAFRRPGAMFLTPGVPEELHERTVIDLSHESLMRIWPRLAGWVEEESRSARVYQRLAESARIWREGHADLYQGPDLQIARSWREAESPNAAWAELYGGGFEDAMAFLDASRDAAALAERELEEARRRELEEARALAEAQRLRAEEGERAAGRLRWLAGGLAVALLAAFVAFVLLLRAHEVAELKTDHHQRRTYVVEMNRARPGYSIGATRNRAAVLSLYLLPQAARESTPKND